MKSKLVVLIASLLLSFNAFAISLQDAKAQGLVGEQINGYLGVVKNSAEAKAVVSSVNAKRKAHYEKIANKNQISVSDVAKLAAEKAIQATKKGHYIQNRSGNWVKK
ncbi:MULTISPECIES: YdbL family protein [Shewanella]|uniref:YdbL family protein n=1 Tax=Shewanella fidelis TaxID=173509 RepID=A0AAW8NK67_9GAMM|nr:MULTISPECIES: YdbL family protein [Shewanella]MDR8523603.1 YdbL family protein [Shewanella fidelis]MDW4810150.1 YdbL family protein [Shewanella fidelis]MDW4814295.1 YdbL family protein [Shewanella fidelis]MDW4818386.1 YdbL family protein [Shewanella fidelis]MDW4823962.1 YdbL family protein [Shewanella fidelis]